MANERIEISKNKEGTFDVSVNGVTVCSGFESYKDAGNFIEEFCKREETD